MKPILSGLLALVKWPFTSGDALHHERQTHYSSLVNHSSNLKPPSLQDKNRISLANERACEELQRSVDELTELLKSLERVNEIHCNLQQKLKDSLLEWRQKRGQSNDHTKKEKNLKIACYNQKGSDICVFKLELIHEIKERTEPFTEDSVSRGEDLTQQINGVNVWLQDGIAIMKELADMFLETGHEIETANFLELQRVTSLL